MKKRKRMGKYYKIGFGLAIVLLFIAVVYLTRSNIFGSVLYPLPSEYQPLIVDAAKKHGVDPCVIAGVIHRESRWNPNAHSGVGASGLGQIMPGTFKAIVRLKGLGYSPNQILDPKANIDATAAILAYNFASYGSLRNALVAYNAGGGRVGLSDAALPRETRVYIKIVPEAINGYRTVYPEFCKGNFVKGTPLSQFNSAASQAQVNQEVFKEFPNIDEFSHAQDQEKIEVENLWKQLY